MEEIKFSVKLRSERGRLIWTRKKMSEVTGIPYESIKNWEIGRYEPPEWSKRLILDDLSRREPDNGER